jgi:hypothetical protein
MVSVRMSTLKVEAANSSEILIKIYQNDSNISINDLRFSLWLIFNVDFVLGSLHRMDVGDFANISEVHDASIFRIQVYTLVSFYICSVVF